jgi:hypothetical protein
LSNEERAIIGSALTVFSLKGEMIGMESDGLPIKKDIILQAINGSLKLA